MGTNVGQVQLDLNLNDRQFKSQLSGISGIAKKVGGVLAGAFAVKQIANFGKECLELGSDLAEVQNVVDVAFPTMNAQIDEFAKNAATQFGLSETMAKRYSGTFGSMASAFGFAEKEAAAMSTELTGLTGDVASFYNISQDEAYTKLKSVFTGETESLKDLGVVMTQTALDQYALANGFGKVTSKMTEQEKVALRYAFVQDQLANASGDFARTSDSWANQMRVLTLQFDSIKASIGQGLINLFTPIIKQVNVLLGKLGTLASAFQSFTNMIAGKKNTASSVSDISGELSDATSEAESASEATSAIGDSAKKTAKKVEKSLAGFDKINKLSDNKSDDGSASSSGTIKQGNMDFGEASAGESPQLSALGKTLDGVKAKFGELQGLFARGLSLGLGNSLGNLNNIKKSLSSVKNTLGEIFTDPKVLSSFDNYVNTLAETLGKIAGSVVHIGLNIANNLTAGIAQALSQNKERIKNQLSQIFDVKAETAGLVGDFSVALANISDVLSSQEAVNISAGLTSIFEDGLMNAWLLSEKIGRDIVQLLTKPITDNQGKIKETLTNMLGPLSTLIDGADQAFKKMWDGVQETYDSRIKQSVDKVTEGLSNAVGFVCDMYNKYVAPVLDTLATKVSEVWTEHFAPLVNKLTDFGGSIVELIATLWRDYLEPFCEWIISTILPVIMPIIQTIGSVFMSIFGAIYDVVGGVIEVFTGLIDFITGTLSGDWEKSWNGIKEIFGGIWDAIKGVFEGVWNVIKDIFKGAYDFVVGCWSGAANFFAGIWNGITGVFSNCISFFSGMFTSAWNGITSAFSTVGQFFAGIWSGIKGAFSNVTDWFSGVFSKAWQAVKNVFSAGGKVFSGIKDGIVSVFKTVVNTLIRGINKIIKIPFNAINGMLNKIRDIGILGVEPFKGMWNYNPLGVPQIPLLAQGGFVKKNTPQLAMIGDNRHYGEVVAPENKMQAMVDEAVARSSGTAITRDELESMLDRAVQRMVAALSAVGFNIDGETLARLEKTKTAALDRRYNNVSIV